MSAVSLLPRKWIASRFLLHRLPQAILEHHQEVHPQ